MRRRLFATFCFALILAAPLVSRAEPGAEASPQEIQSYAFQLVNVGEFERARVQFERLAGMTGEPLARSAWFHWGNLLELHAMMDAETLEEARSVLKEAHEAHSRAMARLQAGPPDEELPHLRNRAHSHLEVIEEHRRTLASIEEGEMERIEAAETLDDMNAPAVAAELLRTELDPEKPGADRYFFLALIYRLSYVDHLYLRLRNMWQSAAEANEDLLPEGARARGLDRLQEETEESDRMLGTALKAFGNSPYWLDFLTLSADNHRYQGLLNLMRADLARNGRPASSFEGEDPGAVFESDALKHFEQLMEKTQKVVTFTDRALEDRSVLSKRQAKAYSDAQLERYGAMARETLAEAGGLTGEVPLSVTTSNAGGNQAD